MTVLQVAVQKNTHLQSRMIKHNKNEGEELQLHGPGQNWIMALKKKNQEKNKKLEWFHPFTAWSGDGFGLSHTIKCDKLPNNRNWLSGNSKGQKKED